LFDYFVKNLNKKLEIKVKKDLIFDDIIHDKKPANTKDKESNKDINKDNKDHQSNFTNNTQKTPPKQNSFFGKKTETPPKQNSFFGKKNPEEKKEAESKIEAEKKPEKKNPKERIVNEEQVDSSVFILKQCIHDIMNVLTTYINQSIDIPLNVRKAFKCFISENSILPKSFLTTMEFNRLEWSIHIKLKRMTAERRSMLIGTIFLYRCIAMGIFLDIFKYIPELKDKKDPNIKDLKENFDYNFKLIGFILAKIFEGNFNKSSIYREDFKEKHLFPIYMINTQGIKDEILAADDFELDELIPKFPDAEEFLTMNYKWASLFRLSASELCNRMVEYIQ